MLGAGAVIVEKRAVALTVPAVAASAPVLALAGLVNSQLAAHEFLAVEFLNGGVLLWLSGILYVNSKLILSDDI